MAEKSPAELLAEAESAYHDLSLGRMPRVIVDQNGERVEFTAARKSDLYSYILQLRSQVGGVSGIAIPRPLGFYF